MSDDLRGILTFVKNLERLKNTTRTAWTSQGNQESTAEHTFRLALFVFVLKDYFPELDLVKALLLSLVHDLGEAYAGDFSAVLNIDPQAKLEKERQGLKKLIETLPPATGLKITTLFTEYTEGKTPEARLVKALDKLETIIQHNQGKNPEDFNYRFNLGYGQKYMDFSPIIQELRRMVDEETTKKVEKCDGLTIKKPTR